MLSKEVTVSSDKFSDAVDANDRFCFLIGGLDSDEVEFLALSLVFKSVVLNSFFASFDDLKKLCNLVSRLLLNSFCAVVIISVGLGCATTGDTLSSDCVV